MESYCSVCQGIFASPENLTALADGSAVRGFKHHSISTLDLSVLDGCPICKIVKDSLPSKHYATDHTPLYCTLTYSTMHASNDIMGDNHPWRNRRAGFELYFACPGLSLGDTDMTVLANFTLVAETGMP